jgi:hypothetical protein
MNLDVKEWKMFEFVKIFDIQKGFYNKKPDSSGVGTIPFLGATESNNGVTEHYTYEEIEASSKTGEGPNEVIEKKIFPANSVCVTNNGSVGYAYYQNKPFTCSHDVNPLYLLEGEFNEFTGIFVATVIMHDRYRWGYGRKWRPERMISSKLPLPILYDEKGIPVIDNSKKYSDEGFIPDWEWMENYIKTLHHKPITTAVKTCEKKKLDTQNWKKFKIGKLFDVQLSKGDIKLDDMDDGPIPLVSSGETHNGIVGFINACGDGKAEIFKGNKITVDMFGNAFYQPDDFYAVSHGRVNILNPNFTLTKNIGLFIASLIKKEQYKYSYGRAVYSSVAADMEILLPIKKHTDGTPYTCNDCKYSSDGYIPDWEWIENYIKSLPYSDRI